MCDAYEPVAEEQAKPTGTAVEEITSEQYLYNHSVWLLNMMRERAKAASSREFALAITKLEESVMWQERTGLASPALLPRVAEEAGEQS